MRFLLLSLIVCFTLVLVLTSCEVEDNFVTGSDVSIRFEVDSLRFDTVFTQRGSATRFFKVYNEGGEPIKLDRVQVSGTTGVNFSINVDGSRGPVVEDVIIWENDSIYVFVEVEIDPTAPEEVSPFIVEDRLVVTTGERDQSVVLEAFGQNANYINGFGQGVPFELSCGGGTAQWTPGLPYVIYGEMFLSDCTLEMLAGTRVYIHGGVARNEQFGIFNDGFIFTLPTGTLRVVGEADNPVIIQTDRLEAPFQDEPGQYLGIIFGPESTGNHIEHAQILHGIQGVIVDSLAELTLENTIIAYTLGSAISGRRSTVTASNCLFHSNFGNSIQFIQGGNLTLDHCTVANYGVDASALALQNFECFNEDCSSNAVVPIRATIRNSILGGSRRDEIIFVDGTERMEPGFFDVSIENSVVRVEDLLTASNARYGDFFENFCTGCFNLDFGDPLFISIDEDDYQLDSLSVALDLGTVLPGLEFDLNGVMRTNPVDAGAFEREE
ncbi:MAG: hypothetical protein AAF828_04295 [Bacteroidota bacterium]